MFKQDFERAQKLSKGGMAERTSAGRRKNSNSTKMVIKYTLDYFAWQILSEILISK
jgi:hypothetical protein